MKGESNLRKNKIAKHVLSFCILIVIMLQAGCTSLFGTRIKPEPVSFNHPDEFIEGDGFMVLADRRIFTLMAFLNAVGFDKESDGQKMHPVRVKVRELVAANLAEHPKKVKKWKEAEKSFSKGRVHPPESPQERS